MLVDQFGYRPNDEKVAVLRDPKLGRDAAASYRPAERLELVRLDDDRVVARLRPIRWNNGAVQESSGDRGWWVDFSRLTKPGEYALVDRRARLSSGPFRVGDDVYDRVLRAACRVFFYQRAGHPRHEPYAEAPWTDGAAFLGPHQDTQARYYRDPEGGEVRDLRGGWIDAGHVNKYTTFSADALHPLFSAYRECPHVFGDDNGIPESGDGIPDLINEARWNLSWLRRMQTEEGGVINKMGEIDHAGAGTPPSRDTRPRFYGEVCSSSTIAFAATMSHAAMVWDGFPELRGEAAELRRQAERAIAWYLENPKSDDCDDQSIKSGDADRPFDHQERDLLVASTWLYLAKGNPHHHRMMKDRLDATLDFLKGSRWVTRAESAGEALTCYAASPGADPDAARRIRKTWRDSLAWSRSVNWDDTHDLYRAPVETYDEHWGGSQKRSMIGCVNFDKARLAKDHNQRRDNRRLGMGQLHYLHGVNPMGLCYLSNMGSHGAERSVMQIYHVWFRHGSPLDGNPAPGYLVGGPNPHYTGSLEGVRDQPTQKAYLDANEVWPEKTWELSEPSNTYQAAHVKLLSRAISLEWTD